MKKFVCVFLSVLMAAVVLSSCGVKNGSDKNKKINIVVTTFPQYDWVKNIMGEQIKNAELTMLIDNGIDLHSFQPSASDIIKISECDMFIYVGGVSDAWVDDALKTAKNKNMVAINLIDVLGEDAKEEEIVEGMEPEEEEHEHEDKHEHEEEGIEYDEHVWLSLDNAEEFCEEIAEGLSKIDPENEKVYEKNLEAYLEKLDNLDNEYEAVCENASIKTLLFADRFPFRYLVDDYGLKYYAAFVGCSAETEASFKTVSFLSEKVDELNLKAVLTIEGTNHKIAETVIKNAKANDVKILSVDSLQSVTKDDIEKGVSYLNVMEKNLEVLKEALN